MARRAVILLSILEIIYDSGKSITLLRHGGSNVDRLEIDEQLCESITMCTALLSWTVMPHFMWGITFYIVNY